MRFMRGYTCTHEVFRGTVAVRTQRHHTAFRSPPREPDLRYLELLLCSPLNNYTFCEQTFTLFTLLAYLNYTPRLRYKHRQHAANLTVRHA